MKIFFLILCFPLFLFNCSKSNDVDVLLDGDYVKCNINGDSFSSFIAAGTYGSNILAVTGMDSSGENFVNITISNPVAGKTYNLSEISSETDFTSVTTGVSEDVYYTAGYTYGSGTITLSHFDEESAAGTFSAEAEREDDENNDLIPITSGKFSIEKLNSY